MRRHKEHTVRGVEDDFAREREERTTENKMERRVSSRFEKYWTENGRGDGQGDVEKEDQQSQRLTLLDSEPTPISLAERERYGCL